MHLDVYQPTFLIEIEGKRLSKDITHEITSFVFEDNEEEMDVLNVSITDRYLQFVTTRSSKRVAISSLAQQQSEHFIDHCGIYPTRGR